MMVGDLAEPALDSDHGLRRPGVAITFTSFVALCAFDLSGLFPAKAYLYLRCYVPRYHGSASYLRAQLPDALFGAASRSQ